MICFAQAFVVSRGWKVNRQGVKMRCVEKVVPTLAAVLLSPSYLLVPSLTVAVVTVAGHCGGCRLTTIGETAGAFFHIKPATTKISRKLASGKQGPTLCF